MNVTAVFHGILSDWVGTERSEFELAAGSRLLDLLREIGEAYRPNMPEQLWDSGRSAFAKPVLAFRRHEQMKDPEESLSDGDEIRFLLMLAGG